MLSRLRSLTKLRPAFFLFAALLTFAGGSRRAHAQVVVIANNNVSASQISQDQLRDLFTGAASSIKGSGDALPVLLKNGPAHEAFLKAYIGKSDAAFRAEWRSLLFSGQSTMPKTFDSDAAAVEYVAHTRGAIGYIAASSSHPGVKTLAVR